MPREDIALRMVCSLAGVEFKMLRLNQLVRKDWDKLFVAVADLGRRMIFIDDKPAVTVAEFRSNIRKIKRDIETGRVKAKKLVLAATDYLQLMKGEQGQGREREIASLTYGLKNTAKTEKVPVLALAQLNRDVEKRTGAKGKRPQLSDLRESGAAEQDADNIFFIYREAYYDKEANNEAEIILAKQRNGPNCTVLVAFNGPTTTFSPLARGYEEFNDFGDDPGPPDDHWQDT
jgi:replicative DNA helicase